MARLQFLVYVTLLVSIVYASPVHQNKKRSFYCPTVQNRQFRPNGPAAYRKALLKFGFDDINLVDGGDVAARLHTATLAAISGNVPAAPTQNDAQFLSPVSVGGQTLVLNFDSGSSDTWVFSTNLPGSLQNGHTIYDPSKSSNFQLLSGSTFNITYGDGSFSSGPVGLDTVDIGGATVNQQAIGLPNVVASSFVNDPSSNGLVGLAFSKLNTVQPNQQKTFFDNIMPELSQPVFTASLKHNQVGSYTFGTIDTSAFSGNLVTVPVDSSRGFWEFESASAVVNGIGIDIPNGRAIADTGTSLMLVDNDMLIGYWNQVDGAQWNSQVGGVIFPCDSSLPDLQVAIGPENLASVSGGFMNFSQVGRDSTGRTYCFGGLQSNQGIPFAIYGDVFFKAQFVVFDGSGPSLGFAPHS